MARRVNSGRARQTEDAKFWLITGPVSYYPIVRQLVTAKKMELVDSARFMALVSTAVANSFIAVFDAKYHYEFWRPITAIRNGDTDDNPATDLDATWQPIDNTPMHPEYPCAHCISSAAVASVIEALLGSADIPEVAMTSTTAPGITHRWTKCVGLCRRGFAGAHLRGLPLSVLDPGGPGHGPQDRPVGYAEADARGQCRSGALTQDASKAGAGASPSAGVP